MRPISAFPSRDRTMLEATVGSIKLVLATDEVDALIAALAEQRRLMQPPHPGAPDDGPTATETETFYDTRYDPEAKRFLLRLRHSGYGWLAWELPEILAREVGSSLHI